MNTTDTDRDDDSIDEALDDLRAMRLKDLMMKAKSQGLIQSIDLSSVWERK